MRDEGGDSGSTRVQQSVLALDERATCLDKIVNDDDVTALHVALLDSHLAAALARALLDTDHLLIVRKAITETLLGALIREGDGDLA